MSPPYRSSVLVAVVVAAGALGFILANHYRAAAPESPEEQIASTQPTIPAQIPAFVLKDSNNASRSSSEWVGKSLVINFWATWCPPCLREIPLLNALQTERSSQNVQVIGIAIDRPEDVLAYLRKVKIAYPVLIGEQEALDLAGQFGVGSIGLPFTVFADNRGQIVTLRLGELAAKEANGILDAVASINAGVLTLDQAKQHIVALHH